jgi:hypothetical protein
MPWPPEAFSSCAQIFTMISCWSRNLHGIFFTQQHGTNFHVDKLDFRSRRQQRPPSLMLFAVHWECNLISANLKLVLWPFAILKPGDKS